MVERRDVDDESKYEATEIIDQSVMDGEKLSSGDSIILYIPNIVSKYPDFTDGTYTVEDIQAFCDEYGITLKITYVQNDSYEVEAIIYQSRKEGYTVARGTTLTIKVVEETSVEETPVTDCNQLDGSNCDYEG